MNTHLSTLSGKSVLVVDDSPEMTCLLEDVLLASGARTAIANDGRTAMNLLMDRHFDLVILDLIMPQPDGLEVLRFMEEHCPELVAQTILLTGAAHHHEVIRLLQDRNVFLVLKPFDLPYLRRAACDLAVNDRPAA